jgi:hypothetical protein
MNQEIKITVESSRFGGYSAFGPSDSFGLLGVGATGEEALAAGRIELARRLASGAASLASVRASGRVMAVWNGVVLDLHLAS